MPTSNPVSTKEKRFEKTKKRWEEAERGLGGLRCVSFYDFDQLPTSRRKELLTEPTILTSDGVEVCVVMTVEDYFAMVVPTQNSLKKPRMCHFDSRLFREVV